MSIYSEIDLNDSSSVSHDIRDTTDLQKINFSNTTNTSEIKFVKTYHVACKINDRYELLILNVKRIDNCIYLYRVSNNKQKLLKTIDIRNNHENDDRNNLILCDLVKMSPDWSVMSIPSGKYILLIDVKSIWDEDPDCVQVPFDKNIIDKSTRHNVYIYRDRIMMLCEQKKKEGGEIMIYISNHVKPINVVEYFGKKIKYDFIHVSENGNCVMYYSKSENLIKILSLSNRKLSMIELGEIKYSNRWLVSDDGQVLFNRDTKRMVIITKYGTIDVTKKIDHSESSLIMLKKVNIYPDVDTYTLVSWDRVTGRYTLVGLVLNVANSSQNITEMYRINYNVQARCGSSIHMNGNIYIYRKKNRTKINDISMFFHIPIVRYMCDDILTRYKFGPNDEVIGPTLLIGNMIRTREGNVTSNLRKIFTPLQEHSRFIIDNYTNIHIIILDNSKKKLDVINVVMYMFDDLTNIEALFDILKRDKLYLSKVYLIFEYMKDIYNYISDYNVDDPNLKLSKRYIELSILYAVTIYRSIRQSNQKNESVVKQICKMTNFFEFSLFHSS